ncbi:MAG: hypothetical protein HETSPECPRED_000789 [Heterodermia speciosa]|uniref:Autophagy-related protein 16 domain-containing protein n=1 Tax=Heterodermia speciosa TaxID=116794 RepID=A0A8H3G7V8_9LECA|nr:MAG: hypothetical protein HETSPECPRED_000789 [Heterodermia speciosa]
MASWQGEYLAALQERDRKEKADSSFYDAYTKLANRAAGLDSHAKSRVPAESPTADNRSRKPNIPNFVPQASNEEALIRARHDLSEAQRSKGVMQSRLDSICVELQTLKLQSQHDIRRIKELSSEKAILSIRMKDQDEELKGKAKLLGDVHDENLSLTLQLNMAEERSQRLHTENKELVDRWMKRMGKEAEDLNKASKFF